MSYRWVGRRALDPPQRKDGAMPYDVPMSRAFLAELRAEIADLHERLDAVSYDRHAPAEQQPEFLVGWAKGSAAMMLDLLDGKKQSRTDSKRQARRWRKAMGV